MRWLRTYLIEPWPQPETNVYSERMARMYGLPLVVGIGIWYLHRYVIEWLIGAQPMTPLHSLTGLMIVVVPVALAVLALWKTMHWRY